MHLSVRLPTSVLLYILILGLSYQGAPTKHINSGVRFDGQCPLEKVGNPLSMHATF